MKVLLTGAYGFLGTHVASLLASHPLAPQLIGTFYRRHDDRHLAQSIRADLREESSARALLESDEFDVCIHLAGVMPPHPADEMFRANILGTANLLRYVRAQKLVLVSSASVYGQADNTGLVLEESPTTPINVYGHSCLARESIAWMYCKARQIELILFRIFNMLGPGQAESMMIPSFAKQIALVEIGQQQPLLQTGPLDTWRDYIDVRDVAVAISHATFCPNPLPSIINIGSGILRSGRQILDILLSLTNRPIQVLPHRDPHLKGNVSRLGNGSTLAASALNWIPTHQLESSLIDVLTDWRDRIALSCR